MDKIWGFSLAGALALAIASTAFADSDSMAYGKYLVEEVGQCQMCHTPKTESGELDKTKWLKGMVLPYAPIEPIKGWHKTAPDITSGGKLWQRWGDAGMVKFLTTGLNPKGNVADPPMPAYKLKQKDAEAIVEYLKSFK